MTSTTCFIVLGVAESNTDSSNSPTESQKVLVAVATNRTDAEKIIGEDYLSTLQTHNLNPINRPISVIQPVIEGSVTEGYSMLGYTWYIVPVEFDTLLNFTF